MSFPNCPNDSIARELICNLNCCVTVATTCACFTGLLTAVCDDIVKLVDRCGCIVICRLSEIQAIKFCPGG